MKETQRRRLAAVRASAATEAAKSADSRAVRLCLEWLADKHARAAGVVRDEG